MQTALEALGRVDILVNNAGIVRGQETKPVWEITDEEWRRGIDTNLSGAFYCVRAIAKHMAERGSGKIINVASGFAYRGRRNEYMYTSAKAAVVNLTRSLALSLADYHIQVNCLVPGFFIVQPPDTPVGQQRRQQQGRFLAIGRTGEPEELGPLAVFLASAASDHRYIPDYRLGQPDDLAALTVYLASDFGGNITGQAMYIEGGVMSHP
jgi:NAD(P)-dependent dehydrogenase (short-subunit alcohol dehydrogenase family)